MVQMWEIVEFILRENKLNQLSLTIMNKGMDNVLSNAIGIF